MGRTLRGRRMTDEALEQLRFVFNLCDSDQDGIISVDEFRKIGHDHFDKTKASVAINTAVGLLSVYFLFTPA